MVNVPHKTLERKLIANGYDSIIGTDEVGMACLAGPVVVCAMAVSPEFYGRVHPKLAGLSDSKLLSAAQRERFSETLCEYPNIRWEISMKSPKVIDALNIYQASRVAMKEAVQKLVANSLDFNLIVLVDGNKTIADLSFPQRAIVRGDRKIWAIAAASVLAKVHRDRLMTEYAREFPLYGFEQHKGYPTALHRARLALHGPCPIHRRSFAHVVDRVDI